MVTKHTQPHFLDIEHFSKKEVSTEIHSLVTLYGAANTISTTVSPFTPLQLVESCLWPVVISADAL